MGWHEPTPAGCFAQPLTPTSVLVNLPALLQSLMSALLVLEGMVRPEFLKQQWRPFAQPAPHPDDTSELLGWARGKGVWLEGIAAGLGGAGATLQWAACQLACSCMAQLMSRHAARSTHHHRRALAPQCPLAHPYHRPLSTHPQPRCPRSGCAWKP